MGMVGRERRVDGSVGTCGCGHETEAGNMVHNMMLETDLAAYSTFYNTGPTYDGAAMS